MPHLLQPVRLLAKGGSELRQQSARPDAAVTERFEQRKYAEEARQKLVKDCAKRAYPAAHPDATEQEFEANYAALLQQRGFDAVVEQRGQLRAHIAKRVARGI